MGIRSNESRIVTSAIQEPTFIKVFSQHEIPSITKAQASEIVWTYLGTGGNRLSDLVMHFLMTIMQPEAIILESDSITQLCRGLRNFEDEIN